MMELIVLVGVLLLVLCLAMGISYRRRKAFAARRNLGLSWLRSMANLLAHFQQHRGLSTGVLNGSEDLMNDVGAVQQAIKRDLQDIESLDAWVLKNERWLSIRDHWERLETLFRQKTPDNNLAEHNALIQNMLYLIDDMAQAHELVYVDQAGRSFPLLWRELLSAAEYIGQARAMGTGVSAVGSCNSVARIRLSYLTQKIVEHTNRVWSDLSLDREDQQPIERLVMSIKDDILKDSVTIKPADFFALASQAIGGLQRQYERLIEEQRVHRVS